MSRYDPPDPDPREDEPEGICNPDTPDDPTPDCYYHGVQSDQGRPMTTPECGKVAHEECGGKCFEPAGHTWPCTADHQRGCSVFKNIPLKLALLPLIVAAVMDEEKAEVVAEGGK